jgi:hypothetical protein
MFLRRGKQPSGDCVGIRLVLFVASIYGVHFQEVGNYGFAGVVGCALPSDISRLQRRSLLLVLRRKVRLCSS